MIEYKIKTPSQSRILLLITSLFFISNKNMNNNKSLKWNCDRHITIFHTLPQPHLYTTSTTVIHYLNHAYTLLQPHLYTTSTKVINYLNHTYTLPQPQIYTTSTTDIHYLNQSYTLPQSQLYTTFKFQKKSVAVELRNLYIEVSVLTKKLESAQGTQVISQV